VEDVTKKAMIMIDKTKSLYDQSRDTVGKIYRDLHMNSSNDPIIVGDMSNEMMKDLVVDINEALDSFSRHSLENNDGKPFYLMIHEKKDLQMKSALARRMIYFGYRPWPEDDTTVFWCDQKSKELRFCWSLPHHTEMDNMLANPDQFDKDLIKQIKAWKAVDLTIFGFHYDKELKWIPNPSWKDKSIEDYAKR
jgi:hypothetical protein